MATVTISTIEAPLAIAAEVGTVDLLTVITVGTITAPLAIAAEVTDSLPVVTIAGTLTAPLALGAYIRFDQTPTTDPRTPGAEQWRYVVTDLQGAALGELVDIEHDPVEDGINEMASMAFTIAMDDPDRAMILPSERQCQVWQGNSLRLRGPFDSGQASEDGTTMTYRVSDPSWWWRNGGALIGRTPSLNLLTNGDFDQGLTGWTAGHDADSIPASNPTVHVVADTFTGPNGHAAEIVGVESVTITSSELSSNAVFWPNLATFRPGGAASVDAVATAMPSTAGLKVSIVGHTANDGTGSGMALSLRRAQAAAARVAAIRPGAVITTKGVGYYDPKPGFPIDSQEQRRVVISYSSTTTITAKSKQWIRQTVEVMQPKAAAYGLDLAAAVRLKVTDDWSVADANMVSLRLVARRKSAPSKPWDEQKGVSEVSISDTDPVDRWIPASTSVTIPADGRPYLVDVYLYAPAALARYTRVILEPQEMLYFWGVDQALIVKGIVEHMQLPLTKMGHVWPITVGTRTPLTGVLRDKEYPFSARMPVETALDDLMSLYNGLDIDVPPHPTDNIVNTYFPHQGQLIDFQLVQNGNVVKAVPATTNDVGSLVIAQSQDSSTVRDEAYAIDPSAFGGMIRQRLITAEQDTPLSELDETATAELAWSKVSTPAYWLDIDPEAIPEVMAHVGKGDTVRLLLDFPNSVDALARVVKRQIHPSGLRLMVSLQEV